MAKATSLPAAYAWLAAEAGPRVLVEALALYGKGDDARLFARRALDYGDANAAALVDGREAYGRVRDELAGSESRP